jgi:hypothetical protein
VIDPASLDAGGRVVFGATVVLERRDRRQHVTYQIVGDDEADLKKGLISISSPIARALIKPAKSHSIYDIRQLGPDAAADRVGIYFNAADAGRRQGGAFSFGKSRAAHARRNQQLRPPSPTSRDATKRRRRSRNSVDFLKDPQKFQKLGGRIPRGVLMVGPPGTGKTLLARPSPARRRCRSSRSSGSDFVEMFVGVGAARVRDMFEQAKKSARASSSSTRSTPSARSAAPAWAAATTSASRP